MLKLIQAYQRVGLVPLIVIGLILGILVGSLANPTIIGGLSMSVAQTISILGALFVGALKAIAPLLVFILIIAAISQHKSALRSMSAQPWCCIWQVRSWQL